MQMKHAKTTICQHQEPIIATPLEYSSITTKDIINLLPNIMTNVVLIIIAKIIIIGHVLFHCGTNDIFLSDVGKLHPPPVRDLILSLNGSLNALTSQIAYENCAFFPRGEN